MNTIDINVEKIETEVPANVQEMAVSETLDEKTVSDEVPDVREAEAVPVETVSPPVSSNRTVSFPFVIPEGSFSKKEFGAMNGMGQPGANDIVNAAVAAGILKVVGKQTVSNPDKPEKNKPGKPTILFDVA